MPMGDSGSLASNLPIIFLVTDGAVQNEHEICDYAKRKVDNFQADVQASQRAGKITAPCPVRTFTFGGCVRSLNGTVNLSVSSLTTRYWTLCEQILLTDSGKDWPRLLRRVSD
jgi:hypothetical protein